MHKAIHYTQESFLNTRAISSMTLGRVRESNICIPQREILVLGFFVLHTDCLSVVISLLITTTMIIIIKM